MPNVNIEPIILSAAVDEEGAQKTITLVLAYDGEVNLNGKFTVGNTLKMELPSKPQP
jgi:hypothetical protein